jgi:SAM-dependent methyltransferase
MPTFRRADWYATPDYCDILFEDDTRLEGAFLEAALERFSKTTRARRGSEGLSVLEIASGSGRLLVEMARRGWKVAGIDLSARMVEYSRRRLAAKGLAGELQVASMVNFRFRKSFDLAHCLINTFKHLLDEKSARATLQSVARSLKNGGIFVLGMHLTQYNWRHRLRERWVAERGGTRIVCNIQSWPPEKRKRVERVRARLTVEEKGRVDRTETLWNFRTYDAKELRRLLASVPELEHVATYDFTYGEKRELNDEQLDCVLILRRR